MEPYSDSESKYPIDLVELASEEPQVQRAEMENWFRAHYEDPGERTPYITADGGYQYIWGGPYEADEELYGKFSGYVPEAVMQELIADLENECMEWAPTPSAEDYDDYYAEAAVKSTEHLNGFEWQIVEIKQLLDLEIEEHRKDFLYRLLFANVITAMESYLSDVFISTVASAPRLMRKFIESHKPYKERKIRLSEVPSKADTIEDDAKKDLARISFHDLPKVAPLFEKTLGINFSDDYRNIMSAVYKRHDLVHRNGFTIDAKPIYISAENITDLIAQVDVFVSSVDSDLRRLREEISSAEEDSYYSDDF